MLCYTLVPWYLYTIINNNVKGLALNFSDLTDKCIFRYRFFNENTLSEILNCSMWHASLDSLNDPYELPFFFDWSCFDEKDLGKSLALINKQLLLFDPMEKLTSHLVNNKQKEAEDFMRMTLQTAITHLEQGYRSSLVTCFSQEPSDALMWSHYADGMRGICVAYDVDKLQNSKNFELLAHVNYDDKATLFTYKDFDLVKPDPNDNRYVHHYSEGQGMSVSKKQLVIRNVDHIFQKHSRWKYEKEIRNVIINPEGEPNGMLVPFDEHAIKAIIYGSKLASTNLSILKLVCNERGIPLFKASPKRDDFTVTIE